MTHVSPSQLATFKACPRKWAYRYIDGIKIPPKKEQAFGLEGHKRNENYLRHGKFVGDDDVGKVCQQGIKPGFMPTPAPDLLIESKLVIPILDNTAYMIGYVDCVLPPRKAGGTLTLPVAHDWKFTKDLRWAMTPAELYKDAQAAVYSYWLWQKYQSPKVVARWIYFCGRVNAKSEDGRPRTPRGVKKVELTFTAAEVKANWQRELEVAKQIVETKKAFKKAEDVPGNERACNDYGGCDHRERCPLGGVVNIGALMDQWDRTHDSKETEKMSKEDTLAALKAHKAAMAAQREAVQKTAAPTGEAPPAEKQQTQTTPPTTPVEPRPQDTTPTGIEHVAALQAQSGAAEPPPAEPVADGPNLLATLQAQTGATGINPPEAPTETTEQPPAAVTEAQTETTEQTPPPLEALTEGENSEGLGTHEIPQAEPAAETTKPTKPAAKGKRNTAKATKVPFVLCIDSVPSKLTNGALGEVIHLSEFVEPFTKAIAKGHRCEEHPQGVDHWNLIEFNKGVSILAHNVASHLDTKGFSGVLVVDSYTAEGRALTDVLIRRADAVFRGVR